MGEFYQNLLASLSAPRPPAVVNSQPGCQPKAQTSTERLRKLTPTGTSAPFWASAPRGAYVGRAALSPRIGHFSGHGLARCQRIIKKGAPFQVGLRRRLGTDGKGTQMDNRKYIGMDVHQASISIAVSDAAGKVLMECIIETKAGTVLEFIQGLRGSLSVTFEEGTSAAWLYDLLKPHVTKVVVCDPRKNALLKAGNKNDRVDARKLSDLLRAGLLTPVYHGESGVRTLLELSRSYLAASKDLTRVMNRLKAIYRSWAIPCAGQQVYSPRHRAAWLEKLREAGVRRRAEQTYQQLG